MNDLRTDIVLHRLSGTPFKAIAMLYDVPMSRARYHCRRAVKDGWVTHAEIDWKPQVKALRIPHDQYDAHWFKRIAKHQKQDENGCLIWQASMNTKGYGQTAYRAKTVAVHRKTYELVHNVKLKTEEFVCHRCDVRACGNVNHLFVGDAKINNSDYCAKGRNYEARRSHCERGHPLFGENMRPGIAPNGNPNRHCKACQRGRLRIKAGWPVGLAYSLPVQPLGYTINPNKLKRDGHDE